MSKIFFSKYPRARHAARAAGCLKSNVRQMFNHPNKTSFKPTKLPIRRKLVANKANPANHAGSSAACQDQKPITAFVKEAYKARDTIHTALAAIENLPAHDDREGVPPSYRQEYTQSIRTLGRIIRREWNHTISTYLSAPESSRSSSLVETSPPRSPSPLPPRKSISSDSVEF